MNFEHHVFHLNNDYSHLEKHVENLKNQVPPSLHVVIPYHRAQHTIGLCVEALHEACNDIQEQYPDWQVQMTLVVDGDVPPELPATFPLRTISLSHNAGRSAARNLGLYASRLDLTLFLDADVLIHGTALLGHLRWHQAAWQAEQRAITCGMFHFMPVPQHLPAFMPLEQANDWRLHCTYRKEWACCEDDLRFAGVTFRLLADTDHFKQWPRGQKLGPFVLPNMVLGGCFMVHTRDAQQLGGQDLSFSGYGYEETTLATRLLVYTPAFVVPVTETPCFHLEDPCPQDRLHKDQWLREAHHRYFEHFLKEPLLQPAREAR